MRRAGEQRALNVVFPVAGKRPPHHHLGGTDRASPTIGDTAGDHQHLTRLQTGWLAECDRRQPQRCQRAHQTESCGHVVAHHARRNGAAVVGQQPHVGGLEHQVADGQHQAVVVDDDARTLPRLAQRGGGARAFDCFDLDADHGGLGAFQRA